MHVTMFSVTVCWQLRAVITMEGYWRLKEDSVSAVISVYSNSVYLLGSQFHFPITIFQLFLINKIMDAFFSGQVFKIICTLTLPDTGKHSMDVQSDWSLWSKGKLWYSWFVCKVYLLTLVKTNWLLHGCNIVGMCTGEGDDCTGSMLLGVPATSECSGKDLYCDFKTRKCAKRMYHLW